MKGISRRQLFEGATGVALATAAASTATHAVAAERPEQEPRSPDRQDIVLRCAYLDQPNFAGPKGDYGDPKLEGTGGVCARLRAYNGQVPGPLITTRPGQLLNIKVVNDMPPNDPKGWDGNHNVPHNFNSTNLHTHGLDVRPHLFEPLGTSNPLAEMISIHPGESKDYPFQIPDDQPPGLYWYHPHHHGSTAVQAVSGMAGPLIVKGDIDEVPEIKAAKDILLAIQDVGLFVSNDSKATDKSPLYCYEPKQNAIWQTFGGNVTIYDPKTGQPVATDLTCGFTTGDYPLRYYLMNGKAFFKETHNQADPTDPTSEQMPVQRYQIAQGEVVRFRMLNACSDNLMPIVVQGHEMHLIALDGVNFTEVRTIPVYDRMTGDGQVLLAPANRAEFLIQGINKPGVYKIMQLAQKQQFLQSAQKTICEIEVTHKKKPMKLPTKLPKQERNYPLIKPEEIKNIRTIQFGGTFPGVLNPVVGIDFLINNMQYEERAVPVIVERDTCEEWHLVVEGPHHGGTEGHPFHIHVDSFEVIKIGNVEQPPGTFMDTVWVPVNTTVVIRMKFLEWVGKSVFHCHILPHEDTGMMQNFLILDPKEAHKDHR
jgi:suppressor of ftsI